MLVPSNHPDRISTSRYGALIHHPRQHRIDESQTRIVFEIRDSETNGSFEIMPSRLATRLGSLGG
jgi:hypothetical protein